MSITCVFTFAKRKSGGTNLIVLRSFTYLLAGMLDA